ncbi:MAG: 50S ribosomal protein L25 [Nitrospinaceae bacterium]
MSLFANLAGKLRDGRKKGPNRRLRQEGLVPAIVYGRGKNLCLSLNSLELTRIIEKGANALIELSIEGDSAPKRTVVFKETQKHPFRNIWLHVDFYEVDMKKKVKVGVPIHFEGHSPGEKLGGMVEPHMHELHIRCLPEDIPDEIVVAMEKVELDQVVHVADLEVPSGLEVLDDPGDAVVAVHAVKAHDEEVAGEEAGEAEEGAPPAAEQEAKGEG